ncbi:hypothetical protein ML8HA_01540 [Lactococcus lactis]|nr:hypothetical protein [Lactococcus lactis]
MKLMCKLFKHKWDFPVDIYGTITCERCGIELKDYWSKKFHSQDFNRSDLDESENVFPEKWLDEHNWIEVEMKKFRLISTRFEKKMDNFIQDNSLLKPIV